MNRGGAQEVDQYELKQRCREGSGAGVCTFRSEQ